MDRDNDDRDLMIEDVLSIVNETKQNIDAILITGDITFKAAKDEFDTAFGWLEELAEKFHISILDIFVVPGNHDVNRSVANEHLVHINREHFLKLKGQFREDAIINIMRDDATREILLKPMVEYNNFAKRFNCELTLPERPFWEHRLDINDKYELCLNGLTSTLFSSEHDAHHKLFMGQFQCNFKAKAGTVHLAMFHHPKEWLADGNEVEDMLSDKAQIWLSGHEHRQRYRMDERYLSLPSAAVNPSRHESGSSGYSIIELDVVELSDMARLDIKVIMRTLQDNPKQYVPRKTHDKKDILTHSIDIAKSKKSNNLKICNTKIPKINIPYIAHEESVVPENNDFINRLWKLSRSKRRAIFTELPLTLKPRIGLSEEIYISQSLREVNRLNLIDLFEKYLNEQERM